MFAKTFLFFPFVYIIYFITDCIIINRMNSPFSGAKKKKNINFQKFAVLQFLLTQHWSWNWKSDTVTDEHSFLLKTAMTRLHSGVKKASNPQPAPVVILGQKNVNPVQYCHTVLSWKLLNTFTSDMLLLLAVPVSLIPLNTLLVWECSKAELFIIFFQHG